MRCITALIVVVAASLALVASASAVSAANPPVLKKSSPVDLCATLFTKGGMKVVASFALAGKEVGRSAANMCVALKSFKVSRATDGDKNFCLEVISDQAVAKEFEAAVRGLKIAPYVVCLADMTFPRQ